MPVVVFPVTRDGDSWFVRLGDGGLHLPAGEDIDVDAQLRRRHVPRGALLFDPESDRADFEARFGPDPDKITRAARPGQDARSRTPGCPAPLRREPDHDGSAGRCLESRPDL